nr:hypothetical protein [Tanacetum cinerariifolium]
MNTTQAQQKALDDALIALVDRQEFADLPLKHDILCFIRDLGHSGDIIYITDEDFLFQIEKKDDKKTNKMSYPRFTKIIIDYFISKDQSISRRNKIFWHTARDDTMFTSMRCISRHEKTQVYGAILSKELTTQAMLESKAYKTYYAFASGEKTPKPKYIRKKVDSDTSPKQKPVQDTNGDEVDTQSKVPDEQHLKTTGADEGTSTMPGVPDVPIDENKSEKESWGDTGEEDEDGESDYVDKSNGDDNDDGSSNNHDDDSDDERIESDKDEIPDPTLTNDDESINEEEEDEVTKELYDDVNVNLGNEYTELTNVDQGASKQQNASQQLGFKQEEEDDYVTLTPVLDTQKTREEPSHTVEGSGMKQDQEFVMGDNDEQPTDKETWISQVARVEEPPTSFDVLKDTSFDFFAFVMNRLQIPNMTQEILVRLAFNLLKGTCMSITELEYHFEECSKATTKLPDWHNPENKPYSFDLRKPLPLIQDHRGRQIIPRDYFVNNDLEYLKGGGLSRQYSTFDASNMTSSKYVYSKRRIIVVTRLKIMTMYDYSHLEKIEVHQDDQKLYTFREGDFKRLRIQDIEDMNKNGIPANEEIEKLRQEKGSSYGLGYRQAALSDQNRRDLPRDDPLDSVEVLSAEGVKELKRNVKIKDEKKEALLTLRHKPVKMEILLEPTSNKLLVGDLRDPMRIELVTLDIDSVQLMN